ncbi:hypothetical protein [Lactiplantibacillus pingfangensis]|uniref:hypothetical protein n=1 Tax=Lactiplantibacillus pingfangensis TaxID=2559915 RepID=UPI0010F8D6E2|nr:hypothetical protein [Lactiplantibacillus pingfangensis]
MNNEMGLFMATLMDSADAIVRAQKVYYDKCIEQGFDHNDAIYLTYHYNPLLFVEHSGDSEQDADDNGY